MNWPLITLICALNVSMLIGSDIEGLRKEHILHVGPKVHIKNAAISTRQRSDLYEVYLTPYRYIESEIRAIATFSSVQNITGYIHVTQSKPPAGLVTLKGTISGLTPGKHGIHIHKFGDLRNNCMLTGPHYNPYNFTHGSPRLRQRHLGDLGNIEADNNGIAHVSITDKMLNLAGSRTIIGRSIVIDQEEDDYKKRDQLDSDSYNPIACAVIGRIDKS